MSSEITELSGDTMVYISGKTGSFRCDCGGNVFRRVQVGNGSALQYRCNSCRTLWYGALIEQEAQGEQ